VKVFGCSDDCARWALRRLTVCQLTRERAEMAVAFGRGCGFASLLGGQLDPGWNLTIGRRSQFSPCLGAHEAHPKNYFVWGCFPKIEWAPAYVDPGGPFGPSALLEKKRHALLHFDTINLDRVCRPFRPTMRRCAKLVRASLMLVAIGGAATSLLGAAG
jgi:hypothetical protein